MPPELRCSPLHPFDRCALVTLRGSTKPIIAREDSDFSEDELVPVPPLQSHDSRGDATSGDVRTKLANLEAKNAELMAELQRQKRCGLLLVFHFTSSFWFPDTF